MKIEIQNRMNLLGKDAIGRASSRVESAFGKYVRQVQSVTLSTSDLNGPRGGIDKRCQVIVRLNGIGDVVAAVEHQSLSTAIGQAIQRAQRSVSKRIEKMRRMKK